MTDSVYQVHKFGGTSVKDASRLRAITSLITGDHPIVVVSAMGKTTNALQFALDAAKDKQDYNSIIENIFTAHKNTIDDLLTGDEHTRLLQLITADTNNIKNILATVAVVASYSDQIRDLVLSSGELWSAQILSAYLAQTKKAVFIDAIDVIHTYIHQDTLAIDWQKSEAQLQQHLSANPDAVMVIPGFTACDAEGKRTILGRNGSDYSAAIIAKLAHAQELIIWTDVDGVYSADPKRVPSAIVLDELSYQEALELAYFGAGVLHPKAIAPAIENNIPILIRNSFNPNAKGTMIHQHIKPSQLPVRGLTSIEDIALINIEGAGMIGVSGFAAKVFGILQAKNISVILISQASSEHSICFAIPQAQAQAALNVLNEQLKFEIKEKIIERITCDEHCSILAVVGEGMIGTRGILAKLTQSLFNAHVNIRAIAQGSSERNISLVLSSQEINRALRAVHGGFYLSNKTISIGVIGSGLVGSSLLKQIEQTRKTLAENDGINLYVRGIANSKKMRLSDGEEIPTDLDKFADYIIAEDIPHAVIIDCTASDQIASRYIDWMKKGAHIITPNKRAGSGDFNYYQELKACSKNLGRHFLYETTVCAGLPVIKTLQDLIQTGDEVFSIEGTVSGTLGYIFHELSLGNAFSSVVKQAKELGYTEPDPRDDLSGMDVARKMVVLARELGFATTLTDVSVENLIPEPLRECSVDEFMTRLPEFDHLIEERVAKAKAANEKWVYVGVIENNGSVKVAMKSYPLDHPFSRLSGADNMLCFRTKRYDKQPLIIQGPGAGAEVTAAGIFADVLRLVSLIA
ncbi:MAG: bifunctional aspartate kinase/homoserine dehydrogenase I [Gammaproteobacteria bacterium]|jgi:aspartokinase/homoserine dehydrogenase 1